MNPLPRVSVKYIFEKEEIDEISYKYFHNCILSSSINSIKLWFEQFWRLFEIPSFTAFSFLSRYHRFAFLLISYSYLHNLATNTALLQTGQSCTERLTVPAEISAEGRQQHGDK